ncbi:TNFAIP3-interacting protein 1-like [Cyclopterus lumpus]|uniref:TNFAIP3 interacting protein 3 n=1 Tax=Cyclopterus lumpus TaxID=8103 RepID=A0A8C2XD20_CYCLU|nr:TNFAIP3-interacting protein 1-like [Cyclopterus lumpus]
MSRHGDTMDRPPVERSQTPDNRQTHRLYPSLPSTDRYQVCAADRSRGGHHPDSRTESDGDVRMKAQILLLQEQRQELLCINEKWAKEYRTMVRYYKERVQELKASLQRDHTEEEEEEEEEVVREEGGNKAWLSKKVHKEKDGDELLKAEKEAEELRAQTRSLTRRGQHQHEEIRRLNRALEEALQTPRPLGVSGETLQDVWKHQAEVYKEDFLKERSDRVKLKEKYLEQEKKFRKVQSQLTWTPAPRPTLESGSADEAARAHREVTEVRHVNQRHDQPRRRRALNGEP